MQKLLPTLKFFILLVLFIFLAGCESSTTSKAITDPSTNDPITSPTTTESHNHPTGGMTTDLSIGDTDTGITALATVGDQSISTWH